MSREFPPSTPELKELIDKVGGVVKASELCGRDRSTIWRWKVGDSNIPFSDWTVLKSAAGVE